VVAYSIAGLRKTFRQRLRGVSMVSSGSMVLCLGAVLMVAEVVALGRIVSGKEQRKSSLRGGSTLLSLWKAQRIATNVYHDV
jgi:hypothetical protein